MAAYAQDFVVSILGENGKPIREANESGDRTVRIPFESEYKIRLKNKNSGHRAKAQVFVDGMDISPGRMFLLQANESLDLERFIQDGDLTKGNRFKFVNREKGAATGEIQDPTNPRLGRVEVLFYKEQIQTIWNWPHWTLGGSWGGAGGGGYYGAGTQYYGASGGGTLQANQQPLTAAYHVSSLANGSVNCAVNNGATNTTFTASTNCANNMAPTSGVSVEIPSEVGGTAMGSDSNQKFNDSYTWFPTEALPVRIEFSLKGLKHSQPQPQPQPAPQFTSMAPQIPIFNSHNTFIYNLDGTMLMLVKNLELHFDMTKNHVEVEIFRKHPKTGEDAYDSAPLSTLYMDPSGKLTIRLAENVEAL